MAHQEIRLSASALALGRFTAEELSKASGAKLATARSWIARNKSFLLEEIAEDGGRRGRPKTKWVIVPDAIGKMRSKLEALGLEGFSRNLQSASPGILDDIERQIRAWQVATRLDDPRAEAEYDFLCRLIRRGWEEFSTLYSTTKDLPLDNLKTLARFEREAGRAGVPQGSDLHQIASWLATHLQAMTERTVDEAFASQVMRLRAGAGSSIDSTRVTAAALAAPVWFDEELFQQGISEVAINLSARVAELLPVDEVLLQVSAALETIHSTHVFDAQAIVCGLISRPRFKDAFQVDAWMFAVRATIYWQPHFAPAALLQLAPGKYKWQRLMNDFGDEAKFALDLKPDRIGALRRVPLNYCKRVLNVPGGGSGSDVLGTVLSHDRHRVALPELSTIAAAYQFRPPQNAPEA